MKYYLEQVTIGYNLDKYLFDSHEEALAYLLKALDLGNFDETKRMLKVTLEYTGRKSYGARWDIIPVVDWEKREFGEPRSYIEIRHEDYASLTEYGAGPDAFEEAYCSITLDD